MKDEIDDEFMTFKGHTVRIDKCCRRFAISASLEGVASFSADGFVYWVWETITHTAYFRERI